MDLNDLVYIDATGYHYADYPAFLAWRTQQYMDIYGSDIYVDPDSQDGQLIAVQAKSDYDTAAQGAAKYASYSPSTAQGVSLSRNVKINGLNRGVPTNSTVDITIVGQAGTIIKNGVVQDDLNQKWDVPLTTIPSGGTITVTATAQVVGAISAGVNSVNSIFTPTLGWQTVTNASAANAGAPVESDASLRARQAVSTANPSLTVLAGTVGAVSNLVGVTKVQPYENDTDSTDANGVPSHSFSLVVAGGDVVQIAQAILLHKTPGTGTYGTTSQLVYDSEGMPVTIKFFRPTVASIKAEVTISAKVGWSTNFIPLIQQAVADTINAGNIGATVLITKLYAPAYLLGTAAGSTFDISLLRIAKNSGSFGTTNISLTFVEQPVTVAASDVTVIVT